MKISIIKYVINKNKTQKTVTHALNIPERHVKNIIKISRKEGYEDIRYKNKFHNNQYFIADYHT